MNLRTIAVSVFLLGLGCGLYFLLPRGELAGTVAQTPGDWSFSDEVTTIQLETRPADPYSVSVWTVGIGPSLYVHAGANRSSWVEHIEKSADVRVRIEEKIYELRASRVLDEKEFEGFSDAWQQKYDMRPRNENVAEAYVFRLGARSRVPSPR